MIIPAAVPSAAPAGISLAVAIQQVIAAKQNAGLRPGSIKVLKCILNQFAKGREAMPLAAVGVRDIESWLAQRTEKPMTRQSNIGRLSALFSYHVRRDNIALNPCRKLERTRIDHTAPVILTPAQAETLLQFTPPRFRAYVVLGMFAGIRPEELLKLTWDAVCLDTKTVTVSLAKTRRRRIVPLEPCAVALLAKLKPRLASDISPPASSVRYFKRLAARHLGFTHWPHDLLRHTAASYLLALHGDAGKVSARLGNSSAILLTHYHTPVKKSDCERFWSLAKLPPAPASKLQKYDRAAIRDFYNACKSYKQTMEHFRIRSAGTLHYILKAA